MGIQRSEGVGSVCSGAWLACVQIFGHSGVEDQVPLVRLQICKAIAAEVHGSVCWDVSDECRFLLLDQGCHQGLKDVCDEEAEEESCHQVEVVVFVCMPTPRDRRFFKVVLRLRLAWY